MSEDPQGLVKKIIHEESEINFIHQLEKISDFITQKYDWWAFSRIEANIDEIFIPYMQDGEERKFYPDFVFWLQKR
ncbi:MAG: hypothetical protein MR902_00825 [Campylobacter sp.]|nr:hypothetical protein [Campylobacter sp.]